MFRVAFCDDDKAFIKPFGDAVGEALKRCGITSDISSFSSAAFMLEVHRAEPFDAVFLDIDMPDVNGFSAAKEIAAAYPACLIVFVTSHNELVYDSFEFRPMNFIVKQEREVMLPKLERVIRQLADELVQNEKIVLENSERGRFSVGLSEIVYIESSDHDVLYHIVGLDEPQRVRAKLSQTEQEYSARDFVRIHKKYLVNLRYVFNIDLTRECVILKTGIELPMGRSCKSSVDQQLTAYLKRAR